MQTDEIFVQRKFGTGEPTYVPMIQPPSFQWHLTVGYSTPDPAHLRPVGIGWSDVSSTGNYVVDNLVVDLVDPAYGFLQMISDVLPTSLEADEIGDRLIQEAIGNPKITPITKRITKK